MNKLYLWRVMRLLILFLLAGFLHVAASGSAQTVTLKAKGISFEEAIRSIRQQTDYEISVNIDHLKGTKPVTVAAENMPIADFLDLILKGQPLDAQLEEKNIVLFRKPEPKDAFEKDMNTAAKVLAYSEVRGRVVDSLGRPLAGATVRVLDQSGRRSALQTFTNRSGDFLLRNVPEISSLEFTFVGHLKKVVPVNATDVGEIVLLIVPATLEEVEVMVNTGYQQLPKERITGSFEQFNAEQLNRSQSPDILSRLEGLSSALLFDRRNASAENMDYRNIRVRGANSIYSDVNPLIILDNFPYEGSLSSINPNDILSIDILKDAAATSIWGGRAANGVIVINTKGGKADLNRIDVKVLGIWKQRPDLMANSTWLDAQGTMEWEQMLFDKGHYSALENNLNFPALSEYVELLIKKRDDLIDRTAFEAERRRLMENDLRRESQRLLYRDAFSQQYHLAWNVGGEKSQMYTSLLWDDRREVRQREEQNSVTLNMRSSHQFTPKLVMNNRVQYTQQMVAMNGLGLEGLVNLPIYSQLRAGNGEANALYRTYRKSFVDGAEAEGLLDWNYYPLDELSLNDNVRRMKNMLVGFDLKYQILDALDLTALYQYTSEQGNILNELDKNSFYVRDLVNQFTDTDGKRVIDYGNILDRTNTESIGNSGRMQLNFQDRVSSYLDITAVLGTEWRQYVQKGDGSRLYGYNAKILGKQTALDFSKFYEIRPNNFNIIPQGYNGYLMHKVDRNVSYYFNSGLTFFDKYLLSLSGRRDASNLFGVNSNQKWAPLWSIGAGWIMSNEDYISKDYIDYLKVRATYGKSGNTNKSTSAYVMAQYLTNSLTNLPFANIRYPANPNLTWEVLKMLNFGIDFSLFGQTVQGSLEYFYKRNNDLLGQVPAESISGFKGSAGPPYTYMLNYASASGSGWDINLTTNWINKEHIRWSTVCNLSLTKSKVEDYRYEQNNTWNLLNARTVIVPREGYPLDALFSLPWAGLDPQNGDPLFFKAGDAVKDYTSISSFPLHELLYHGSKVPELVGSVQNAISYKSLSLNVMLTYRGRYHYRRNSVFYTDFSTAKRGHGDFANRWKEMGDEERTNIPSFTYPMNVNRDQMYANASINIAPADNLQLKNITLRHIFSREMANRYKMADFSLALTVEDLGMVWAKNRFHENPDWINMLYAPPPTISFSVNATF